MSIRCLFGFHRWVIDAIPFGPHLIYSMDPRIGTGYVAVNEAGDGLILVCGHRCERCGMRQ